jgi:zinc/manganese transport system ATP-binding protein
MSDPVVRLVEVAVGYERPLWSEVSLDARPGEFLAVLGGNGAGKTTLLRLMLGQLRPTSGHLEVFGGPPRRGDHRVGYVPQQRGFDPDLPLRGTDLVRFGLDGHRWGPARPSRRTRGRVEAAIDSVGAGAYADAPVGRLSGGEQQRLRIAQAMVGDPQLLLADEPLLSLDLANQGQVAALLDARRRSAGTTVLAVTHEINPLLPYTDRVLYFAGGRAAVGSPDDVLSSDTLSRLYGADVDVVRVRGRVVVVGAPDAPHHLETAPA